MTMKLAPLLIVLSVAPAFADGSYRLVEDAALGLDLPADHHHVLADGKGLDAALAGCAEGKVAPTGSAVFWLEIGKAGTVSAAHVHGAEKLDACLEKALAKGAVADKLAAALVLVGHIDLMQREKSAYLPSPRISTTPIVLDAHGTSWQLTATRIAYTATRMLDITKSLDDVSVAISACAGKRGASSTAAQGLVWMDGHAIVRSGIPAYDACVAKAVSTIKLAAADSSFWLQLEITPPTEALAARSDKAALSHPQAIHDALTTAVRSRKLSLQGCLDGHKGAVLTTLSVSLRGGKANVKTVATGDADADACVKKTFHDIALPSATAADKVDLDVTLDAE